MRVTKENFEYSGTFCSRSPKYGPKTDPLYQPGDIVWCPLLQANVPVLRVTWSAGGSDFPSFWRVSVAGVSDKQINFYPAR